MWAISAYFLCVIIKHFIFHLTNVDFITSFFPHLFFLIFVFFLTIFAHLNNKIWEENKLHANFLSYPIILWITLQSRQTWQNIHNRKKSRKISFIFLCNIYWYCVCMIAFQLLNWGYSTSWFAIRLSFNLKMEGMYLFQHYIPFQNDTLTTTK